MANDLFEAEATTRKKHVVSLQTFFILKLVNSHPFNTQYGNVMTKHVKIKDNTLNIFVIMGCQIIWKLALWWTDEYRQWKS